LRRLFLQGAGRGGRFLDALCSIANSSLPHSNEMRSFATYTWSYQCGNWISHPPPPGAIMRTLSTLFAATFAAAFVLSSLAISAATPSVRPPKR
jgi:hypothetical protein